MKKKLIRLKIKKKLKLILLYYVYRSVAYKSLLFKIEGACLPSSEENLLSIKLRPQTPPVLP